MRHVFCDFDGTIVVPDTLRFLVTRFGGGPAFFAESDRLLERGDLGGREVIVRNMRTMRAPLAELAAALRSGVAMDPGFPAFAAWCADARVPLTVVSAGFEEIVRLFLPERDFSHVAVLASRFRPGTWTPVFRDESAFGHDKAAAVRSAAAAGARTVFVGDGTSDQEAAEVADVVFARRGLSLAAHARARGLPCTEFTTFAEVREALAR